MTGREISVSAAIALAQAGRHPPPRPERAPAGCRFAGELQPGDTYLRNGRTVGETGEYMITQVHRVTVVWGPRLDTTSDLFDRDLIRFWIWDPATGNEGSATFGPRGVVRAEITGPYWVLAPGTLPEDAPIPHHSQCECGTCQPGLPHRADCQCTSCQPGKWAPLCCSPDAARPRRPTRRR